MYGKRWEWSSVSVKRGVKEKERVKAKEKKEKK